MEHALPGLRGGYPTASRLNRILEAIGIALWRYDAMTQVLAPTAAVALTLDSMLDSPKPEGTATTAFPDHRVRRKQFQILPADPVRIGSALREAQNQRNVTHAS